MAPMLQGIDPRMATHKMAAMMSYGFRLWTGSKRPKYHLTHSPSRLCSNCWTVGIEALVWSFDESCVATEGESGDEAIPKNCLDAVNVHISEKWIDALNSEYDSLINMETWKLKEVLVGRKLTASKWVYDTKLDRAGEMKKFQARLVARAFSQTKGVDHDEVVSSVVRYATTCLMYLVAVIFGWRPMLIDVKNASVMLSWNWRYALPNQKA